mgnify:CR=1 FL=1
MRQQALILIYILIHKIIKSKGRLKTMNMGIQTTFLVFLRKLYSGLSTFSQISGLSVQSIISLILSIRFLTQTNARVSINNLARRPLFAD